MNSIEGTELVILVRLDSAHGFFSFSDVLDITGQLQQEGVNAICEIAPGALMDTPDAYFIKVPVEELKEAKPLLQKILNGS